MTASTGHSWTRSYEPHRNLITAVQNTYGPAIISRFDYANDEIGRRVSRADSGIAFDNPAFDVYAYNTRSEVIGAQRYHGTDVSDTSKVYGGRGFGYNYDPIGSAPSEARRFLRGGSPRRVRISHPLVPSVGTMEEESNPNEVV